jgi:hypothetical protein
MNQRQPYRIITHMQLKQKTSTILATTLAIGLITVTLNYQTTNSNAADTVSDTAVDTTSETTQTQVNENPQENLEVNKTYTYPGITPYETTISRDLFNNVSKPFITQAKGNDKKNKHKFTITTINSDTIKIDSNRKAKIMLNLVKTKNKNQKQKHRKIVNLKKGSNIVTGLESGRTYQVKYGFDKKTKKYKKMTRITPLKETGVVTSAYINYLTDNTGLLVKNIDTHWSMGAEANRKIFWRTGVLEINEVKASINPMIEYNYGESHSSSNEVAIPDKGFLQVDFVIANPISIQTQRMWSVAPVEVVKESGTGVILLTTSIPDMQKYADIYHGLYTNKQLFELSENSYKTSKKYLENALNSARLAKIESSKEYNGVTLSAEKAQLHIDQAWFWLNQAYSEIMLANSYIDKISTDYKDYNKAIEYKTELAKLFKEALAVVENSSSEVVKAWVARSIDMLEKAENALNTNQESTIIEEYANNAAEASRNAETEAKKLDLSKTGILPKNLKLRSGRSSNELNLEIPLTIANTNKTELLEELLTLTNMNTILEIGNSAAQLAYSTYLLQLGREGLNMIIWEADTATQAQEGVTQVNTADQIMQELFLEPVEEPFRTNIETYLNELVNIIDKANEHYSYIIAWDEVKNQRNIIDTLYNEIQNLSLQNRAGMDLTQLEPRLDSIREKTLTMRNHITMLETQENLIAENSRHKPQAVEYVSESKNENDNSTLLVNQVVEEALETAVNEVTVNNTTQKTTSDLTQGETLHNVNNNYKTRITTIYDKKLTQEYTVSEENSNELTEISNTYKLATVTTLTGDVLFEETKAENTEKARDARINVIEARSIRNSINNILNELTGTDEATRGSSYLNESNTAIVNAENYAMASQTMLNENINVLTEVAVNRDGDNVWFQFNKNLNDTREAIDYEVEVVRSGVSIMVGFNETNGNYLQDMGDDVIQVNVRNLPGDKEDGVFFRVVQESWERSTQNPTRVDPVDVDLTGLLTMEVSSSNNYTCETIYAPGVLDGTECVDTKDLSYETRAYTYPTTPYTYSTEYYSYEERMYVDYVDIESPDQPGRIIQQWSCPDGWTARGDQAEPGLCTRIVSGSTQVKNPTPAGYTDNGSVWVSLTQAAPPSSGASVDPYFSNSGFTDNGTQYVAISPRPASIHNNAGLGIFYSYEPSVNKYQARTNADKYSTYKPVFSNLPETVLSWEAGDTEYKILEGADTGRNTVIIRVYTLTGVKYLTGSTDPAPRRP